MSEQTNISNKKEFDKKEFARLLSDGLEKHSMTQAELADIAGLSKAYVNRCINMKNDSPPKASTIHRITTALDNDSELYINLIKVAGYDAADALMEEIFALSKDQMRITNTFNIISSAFFKCGQKFSWSPMPQDDPYLTVDSDDLDATGPRFDFGVQIQNSEYIDKWYFKSEQFYIGKKIDAVIKDYYGRLLYFGLKPKTKISIVVSSKIEFDKLLEVAPALPYYISIVLVNMDRGIVADERYIQTFLPLDKEVTETVISF